MKVSSMDDDDEHFEDLPSNDATATGSVSSDNPVVEGEIELLLEYTNADDNINLAPSVQVQLNTVSNNDARSCKDESFYGSPLSPEEAEAKVPEGDAGLKWQALVIPNILFQDGKLVKGLDKKDFDIHKQDIKPRRPSLPITSDALFKSLTKIEGTNGPRYIFNGILNGWPALQCFELWRLDQRRSSPLNIPSPREIMTGQITWVNVWKAYEHGTKGIAPEIKDDKRIYRAILRAPPWSGKGWSKDSPGFAFWHEPHRPESEPRVTYGTNMLSQLADANSKCTQIHMLSHRYAVKMELPTDRITYHSVVLLEWEHRKYCTVVELAYLNGMGGYKGKSNWLEDKDDAINSLYRAMPPEMILPWKMTSAEIRCYDIKSKTLDEFKSFVFKYEGNKARFVDPQFSFSHQARLTFRSKQHIAQYLLNYIQRDSSYADLRRNCQTFVADLCAFLAGKKSVLPFHPVSRVEYTNRTYLFLYDPDMYTSKDKKNKYNHHPNNNTNTTPAT